LDELWMLLIVVEVVCGWCEVVDVVTDCC
nr:hypothetical protein [Tanacetum cinerariifolium]